MMFEKIQNQIIQKQYQRIQLNVSHIALFYQDIQEETQLIAVYYCPYGSEYTKERYDNIRRQFLNKFQMQHQSEKIKLLNIVVSEQVEKIHDLNSEDQLLWVVDVINHRLVLFENQKEDLYSLRKDLEELLFTEYQKSSKESDTSYTPNKRQGFSDLQEPYHSMGEGKVNSSEYSSNYGNLGRYISLCNTTIIILNILVFLYCDLFGDIEKGYFLLNHGALYWPAVVNHHEYYRLISYMFLHGGIEHLVNNMIVLLVIGNNLERAIGKWKFIVLYFGSGILAGITSLVYNMRGDQYAISVGASGAIFGVVGGMVVLVILNRGRIEAISTRQLVFFVIFSLYGGFTSQGVDNAAHIGGLVAGALIALLLYQPKGKTRNQGGR